MTSLEALVPYPPVAHSHGLLVSTLGLGFTVTSSHFLNGSMKVRCVARVSPILWRGDSESVVQRVWPEIEKNTREALILRKSQYDVSTLNCTRSSNLLTAYRGPTDFPESLQTQSVTNGCKETTKCPAKKYNGRRHRYETLKSYQIITVLITLTT